MLNSESHRSEHQPLDCNDKDSSSSSGLLEINIINILFFDEDDSISKMWIYMLSSNLFH